MTVTVNEQLGPAVVVTITVVDPTLKNEPEGGTAVTVPHDPVVIGLAKVTTAPHCPALLLVTIFDGHVNIQAAAIIVSVSVALLFPGVGSVTPPGAAIMAVFEIVPVAAPPTMAVTVKVTDPPDGKVVSVALIFPDPFVGPAAPPA